MTSINSSLFDSRTKIVIVGDVMLDRYLEGQVKRVSPEAPVPVLRVHRSREVPGGAANVALNIAKLGSSVTLVAYVGDDVDATHLQTMLDAGGVTCRFITAASARTIVKLRALSMHQQMLRLDFEDSFVDEAHDALLEIIRDEIRSANVLVLSDYAKGTLAEVEKMISIARDAGVPCIVDPKGSDFKRYQGAYLITPNEDEFRQAARYFNHESDSELEIRGREFCAEIAVDNLLVTRGERGMMLVSGDTPARFISSEAKDVFDVTGAGDTVISVMSLALACGVDLYDATVLANRAAGIVVGRSGTTTVTREELLGAGEMSADVIQQVRLAQQAGERIVMTNGCFDVLHAGHVKYLEEARKLGDRLIVALNTDSSVSRLKGPSRPVNSFEHRRMVLLALRSVDWVIGFGEDEGDDRDTPLAIIKNVAPDVLVKGADYTVNTIVGAAEVLAGGGEVRTIDLVSGISTTEILRRQQALATMSKSEESA